MLNLLLEHLQSQCIDPKSSLFLKNLKKQIEYCDECEEEPAEYTITKGEDKGKNLCSDCLDDYKENIFEEYYEDLK